MSETMSETLTETIKPQMNGVRTLKNTKPGNEKNPKVTIVWLNVLFFLQEHVAFLLGLYVLPRAMYQTLIWAIVIYFTSQVAAMAGNHRLWSHRSYKAKLPLRIFLAIFSSVAYQNSAFTWARDHRMHHKYVDTDADPHNSNRGFIFCHFGWLMVKKHPVLKEKGKSIDVSDLKNDPVVMFQHRYYFPSVLLLCHLLPTYIPVWLWGESALVSFGVAVGIRHTISLHSTWLINSAAHLWGSKPYDKNINPTETMAVSVLATGEGFHNYHHVFPQDYAASEYGWHLNLTTLFIDAMAWIGQAYDLRPVSKEAILKRKLRTGDGQ